MRTEPRRNGSFSCFLVVIPLGFQRDTWFLAVFSWTPKSIASKHNNTSGSMTGRLGIYDMCKEVLNHPKRTCYFPTIDFQGLCLFQGVYTSFLIFFSRFPNIKSSLFKDCQKEQVKSNRNGVQNAEMDVFCWVIFLRILPWGNHHEKPPFTSYLHKDFQQIQAWCFHGDFNLKSKGSFFQASNRSTSKQVTPFFSNLKFPTLQQFP